MTSKPIHFFPSYSIDIRLRYHVPSHIQEHVDYITPGIKLFAPARKDNEEMDLEKRIFGVTSQKGKAGLAPPLSMPLSITLQDILAFPEVSACDQYITPPCVAGIIFTAQFPCLWYWSIGLALYNVSTATKATAGNELGIFEDLGDYVSQVDLNIFFLNFASLVWPLLAGTKL